MRRERGSPREEGGDYDERGLEGICEWNVIRMDNAQNIISREISPMDVNGNDGREI